MLVQHPHLISDVQVAVVATELTLAAARDSIRILSWLKSNAPAAQVVVVANRVAAGQLEISRKDFESSVERRIDFLIPADGKLAAQAAKLGKPLAEAGKASKTVAPLSALAGRVCAIADRSEDVGSAEATAKTRGPSLMGKFTDLKGLLVKRDAK